jgi:3-phosphoglycerate kinase
MKLVSQIDHLHDKKVLVRVDFDIPVNAQGTIEEAYRVVSQKENIDFLVGRGARVHLISHIATIDSFESIIPQLQELLGHHIHFVKDIQGYAQADCGGGVCLLENLRSWPGEKNNDSDFASQLAQGCDVYVNNAFAVCHRAHASVSAITGLLPSYAGLLVEKEVAELSKAISAPIEGKVMVMGGAKAETKVPVVKNFLEKSEKIIIGGILANDILKSKGIEISNVDENYLQLLEGLDTNDKRIVLPEDYKMQDGKVLDIGPQTVAKFKEAMTGAQMVIWNGPLGLFEEKEYEEGTKAIVKHLSQQSCYRLIGGGDTAKAVSRYSSLDKFNFVSTGGGAMLYFLAGQKLPGLEALM